jgi:hypothetical protein
MVGPEIRRSVEKLAQTLYEASDPDGPPWVNRGRVVREPWLDLARQRIRQSEDDHRTGPSTKVEP